jgi:hypothetical protein
MSELKSEIAAYERIKRDLEAKYLGKWVVVHDEKVHAVFDTFEAAAASAVKNFGRGPYLIRQVGAPPITLPASVMYRVINADDALRI